MGCWDTMNVVDPKLSDQDIYDYFQSIADKRAKNGGFAFLVTILLPDGDKDPRMLHVNDVVNKALAEIGHNFYK